MSTRSSRLSPSQSSPLPAHGSSKLPKFLQKQSRDRSKSASLTDPGGSAAAMYAQADLVAESSTAGRRKGGSRILGGKDRSSKSRPSHDEDDTAAAAEDSSAAVDDPPVIVEPGLRARTRSERPANAPELQSSISLMPSSSGRLSELPTRLTGWFQHTFSASTTDLSLPALLTQQQLSSPKGKNSSLLAAAKHGKAQLDKVARYLTDPDANADRSPEHIWMLGILYPGYEAPRPSTPPPRRSSADSRRSPGPSSGTQSDSSSSLSQSLFAKPNHPAEGWSPDFYADFTSRIWMTYRTSFVPLRDSSLQALESEVVAEVSASPKRWNWLGGDKCWTDDRGWGCMLRTGQSLLANALLHIHLGRDWRRPPTPVRTADYATYVRLISWFLDTPSPLCPFSVHRMALSGKDLGTDVGTWFGPSTAAGAIKTLVHAFPDANLGVAVAVDSVIYQTDVYAASHGQLGSPRRSTRSAWGTRPVLVLIGARLGIDRVNPLYYDALKTFYTFPQTAGIAGGRPSSSYWFVGYQGDALIYLDPHHPRPAIPLRPPPPYNTYEAIPRPPSREQWTSESDWENDSRRKQKYRGSSSGTHGRSPTSPASSIRTGSSTFSYHASKSPSPLQKQLSSSTTSSYSASPAFPLSVEGPGEGEVLDAEQEHYVSAYLAAEMATFHCEQVRKLKMPFVDPSMLIGFVCRDEGEWLDLRRRVAELSKKHKPIFSIQDEPPSWPSDSEEYMGLESVSDVDMDMPEDDEEIVGDGTGDGDGEGDDEEFVDARSTSESPAPGGSKGSEADTEEDPIGPITPGPSTRSTFEMGDEKRPRGSMSSREENVSMSSTDDLEDDDWVDPALPTPVASPSPAKPKKSRKKEKAAAAVPIVRMPSPPVEQQQQHYPFPVTVEAPEDQVVSSRTSSSGGGRRVPQLHTVRARDGGRTQSGGVKGVPTDD